MGVYRERKKVSLPLRIGVSVIIVVGLIAVAALIFLRPSPTPSDPLIDARLKAQEAAEGLDIFTVEYPQAEQGAELTGALSALGRAQKAFESAQNDLAKVDPSLVAEIAAGFKTIKEKADARAPANEVLPLAEAILKKLLKLIN